MHKHCAACNPARASCDGRTKCSECNNWSTEQLQKFEKSKADILKKAKGKQSPAKKKEKEKNTLVAIKKHAETLQKLQDKGVPLDVTPTLDEVPTAVELGLSSKTIPKPPLEVEVQIQNPSTLFDPSGLQGGLSEPVLPVISAHELSQQTRSAFNNSSTQDYTVKIQQTAEPDISMISGAPLIQVPFTFGQLPTVHGTSQQVSINSDLQQSGINPSGVPTVSTPLSDVYNAWLRGHWLNNMGYFQSQCVPPSNTITSQIPSQPLFATSTMPPPVKHGLPVPPAAEELPAPMKSSVPLANMNQPVILATPITSAHKISSTRDRSRSPIKRYPQEEILSCSPNLDKVKQRGGRLFTSTSSSANDTPDRIQQTPQEDTPVYTQKQLLNIVKDLMAQGIPQQGFTVQTHSQSLNPEDSPYQGEPEPYIESSQDYDPFETELPSFFEGPSDMGEQSEEMCPEVFTPEVPLDVLVAEALDKADVLQEHHKEAKKGKPPQPDDHLYCFMARNAFMSVVLGSDKDWPSVAYKPEAKAAVRAELLSNLDPTDPGRHLPPTSFQQAQMNKLNQRLLNRQLKPGRNMPTAYSTNYYSIGPTRTPSGAMVKEYLEFPSSLPGSIGRDFPFVGRNPSTSQSDQALYPDLCRLPQFRSPSRVTFPMDQVRKMSQSVKNMLVTIARGEWTQLAILRILNYKKNAISRKHKLRIEVKRIFFPQMIGNKP